MRATHHLPPLLLLAASLLQAGTPEERGLAIATEAERRDSGFNDSQVDVTMVLRDRRGRTSERRMRTRSLEVAGDGDKLLIVFDAPRDVKGTGFLSHTHVEGDDDQWIFLPALKREKRIATSNKTGPFMGSEFAYEDLVSQEIEKYSYKHLRDEEFGGRKCFVVERIPRDRNSGYSRQVVWIDQEHYRPEKVEYHDRKRELLKTLTFEGYQRYLDRYWRADRFHMVNHQTGKETDLVWENHRFRTGLKEADFSTTALRRVR